MTREELKSFMTKIKANYQEFSTEDYVVKEWYKKLEPYDLEDVEVKLEKHLSGEQRKTPPRLFYIADGLKTALRKEIEANVVIRCPYCENKITADKYENHIARHNSIYYIKSKEHYLGQNYNEEKMMSAYQVHFDKFYDKFLEELYCKIEDGEEKERLEKILFVG